MINLSEVPEKIIADGLEYVLLGKRENYFYRALFLPVNGGDPKWFTDKDILRLSAK